MSPAAEIAFIATLAFASGGGVVWLIVSNLISQADKRSEDSYQQTLNDYCADPEFTMTRIESDLLADAFRLKGLPYPEDAE